MSVRLKTIKISQWAYENLCSHRKKQLAVIICYAVLEHLPCGRKFWNGDKWYKFPKSEPFHWKFGNSGKKLKSNGHSRSFIFTSQGCHLFWKNQITEILQKFKPGFFHSLRAGSLVWGRVSRSKPTTKPARWMRLFLAPFFSPVLRWGSPSKRVSLLENTQSWRWSLTFRSFITH